MMLVIAINEKLVPVDGLEPSHPKAGDFESPVSTNSTTLALMLFECYTTPNRLVVAINDKPSIDWSGQLYTMLN